MQIHLEPYSSQYLPGIERFNARLRGGGIEEGYLLPERSDVASGKSFLDTTAEEPVHKQHFLLIQEGEVRGGVILQDQEFEVCGKRQLVTNIQMPVSEGLVDRRHGQLAMIMLRLILKRNSRCYAVGMGGLDGPFPRLLTASRWNVELVPFRFYVLEPRRFLKELRLLRTSRLRAIGSAIAAVSGLGGIGIRILQRRGHTAFSEGSSRKIRLERCGNWGAWADKIWDEYRLSCSFIAVRNSTTLPLFHPLDEKLTLYRFERDGQVCGWATVQTKTMQANRHFGNLRVATILDILSEPGVEREVTSGILKALRETKAELVVANQLQGRALAGMRASGFLEGPSNFVCAMSPQLHTELKSCDADGSQRYVTRADGDGRLHL